MDTNVVFSILLGSFLFLLLHICLWRLRPSNSPRLFLLIGLGALGTMASEIIFGIVQGFKLLEFITILGVSTFLFNAYLMIYSVLARSVSVTILTGLRLRENSRVDFESLLKEYLSSPRFDERIEVMHDSGLVNVLGNRVALTAKGRLLARTAEVFARFFSIGLEG